MRKIPLLIACLFTITAHAELLEFTTPYYVIVDEQGNAVQSVTRSTTPENALKKIINELPDGTYGIVLQGGKINVVRKINGQVIPPIDPPIEPEEPPTEPEEPPVEPPIEPPPVDPPPVEPPPHNHGNMPHVDESKNVATAIGFDSLRIRPTTRTTAVSQGGGEFRTNCPVSHMGVFDPIVYPNQARAGHHHTFFGNVTTNGFSTTESLKASGNTTCLGGIGNRSAYWIPSLIDTRTNAPVKPKFSLFYYKNGQVKPPNGLVILAGDMTANPNKQQATGWSPEVIRWQCGDTYVGRRNHIPACSGELNAMINFPTCWDGVNLDSPDHKSHVLYSDNGVCPATHNNKIPDIAFNIKWDVDNSSHYRLSSDDYVGGAGGYSLHADYMFAWDDAVLSQWFTNCIQAKRDCHSELLGNGLELY
jgi:hypothetical protein